MSTLNNFIRFVRGQYEIAICNNEDFEQFKAMLNEHKMSALMPDRNITYDEMKKVLCEKTNSHIRIFYAYLRLDEELIFTPTHIRPRILVSEVI